MNLRVARKIARLTQAKLAKKAGVEQATISQIESGEIKRPGYETVVRIARALNCSAEELFPIQEEISR